MNPATREGRDELRKVCEAATPGPWDFCACAGDPAWPIVVASGFGVIFNTAKGGASVGDSEFTAAARTALPLALAELDRLAATATGECGEVVKELRARAKAGRGYGVRFAKPDLDDRAATLIEAMGRREKVLRAEVEALRLVRKCSEMAWDEDLLMWETTRQELIAPELPRAWETADKAACIARKETDALDAGEGKG